MRRAGNGLCDERSDDEEDLLQNSTLTAGSEDLTQEGYDDGAVNATPEPSLLFQRQLFQRLLTQEGYDNGAVNATSEKVWRKKPRARRVRGIRQDWRTVPGSNPQMPLPNGPNGRRLLGLVGLAGLAGFAASLGGSLGNRLKASDALDNVDLGPESAFETPILGQGCVLLSRPGGEFALRQQYFHKAVILITRHKFFGDIGLILNRPTAYSTSQLGFPGPPWTVWFGGDCEGLRDGDPRNAVLYCLHTLDKLADKSSEVIRGVYLTSFPEAQQLVQSGRAQRSDFIVIMGYCGWSSGQLQGELARGDWKMASIDSRLIIKELQEELLELRSVRQIGLDDGIATWRHLYSRVDAGFPSIWREDEGMLDTVVASDDQVGDAMLKQWVQANLVEGLSLG
eukprot:CAMPEP_0197680698 /NCGR_PEP_ID=MMETSP1338-20131121/93716_1 /TAXON_ID=43686 ORGANISM="Pelagodinium beii, Strain RCC1491" /NCGR_SAMPLE_ID=MMETSP1338 /ASSEMBLY_ACC=CAM_ASM_000754 /LENGTH=395 /DNA_ID=CAMNT_0043261919 /DNA_START=246 /DNA_END=1433 /DNA_ORIENTATION=-